MQGVAGKPVAESVTVVIHSDRDVDRGAVERFSQRVGDVVVEGDIGPDAVKRNGHPPIPEAVESKNPHPECFSLNVT